MGWFDAYVFCRSEVAVVAVGKIGCTADFEASGGPGFEGGEVVTKETFEFSSTFLYLIVLVKMWPPT